jgi:hypothetical protein
LYSSNQINTFIKYGIGRKVCGGVIKKTSW